MWTPESLADSFGILNKIQNTNKMCELLSTKSLIAERPFQMSGYLTGQPEDIIEAQPGKELSKL